MPLSRKAVASAARRNELLRASLLLLPHDQVSVARTRGDTSLRNRAALQLGAGVGGAVVCVIHIFPWPGGVSTPLFCSPASRDQSPWPHPRPPSHRSIAPPVPRGAPPPARPRSGGWGGDTEDGRRRGRRRRMVATAARIRGGDRRRRPAPSALRRMGKIQSGPATGNPSLRSQKRWRWAGGQRGSAGHVAASAGLPDGPRRASPGFCTWPTHRPPLARPAAGTAANPPTPPLPPL